MEGKGTEFSRLGFDLSWASYKLLGTFPFCVLIWTVGPCPLVMSFVAPSPGLSGSSGHGQQLSSRSDFVTAADFG